MHLSRDLLLCVQQATHIYCTTLHFHHLDLNLPLEFGMGDLYGLPGHSSQLAHYTVISQRSA